MARYMAITLLLAALHAAGGEQEALQYMNAGARGVLTADAGLELLVREGAAPLELELYRTASRSATTLRFPGGSAIARVLALGGGSLLAAVEQPGGQYTLYLYRDGQGIREIAAPGQPADLVPVREIRRGGKTLVLAQGTADSRGEPSLYLLDLQGDTPACRLHASPRPGTVAYATAVDGTVEATLCWLPDGSKCIYNGTRELFRAAPGDRLQLLGSAGGGRVYLLHDCGLEGTCLAELDLQGGRLTTLAGGGREDLVHVLLTPDGHLAGYSTQWGGYSYTPLLPCGNASELERQLPEGTQVVPQQVTADGSRMLVQVAAPGEPARTLLWERGAGLHPADSTQGQPTVYPTYFTHYPAADGTPIPVYYTLPAGRGPFPAVVFVHGGPRMRTLPGYDWRAQYLAHEGFAVVQPQFRGSRGWGKSFMHAGDRQWGKGVMQTDVNDAVPWMVGQGIARQGRIAIFGGSYGGYAATAGLCFYPGLYACGVSLFGPQDMLLYLGSMNPTEQLYAGEDSHSTGNVDDPADRRRLYDISPALHADNFQEPLLLYYGEQDKLIFPEHSRKLAAALQAAGKDVTVISLPDEAHAFAKPANEAWLYACHIVPFLKQHLMKP